MKNKITFSLKDGYLRYDRKKKHLLILLFFIVFLLSALSLLLGSAVSFKDSFLALFGIGEEKNISILLNIRLPRMLSGLAVGGGLAICGLVMQTCLDNPMASPQTLGVSNASVLGANIALLVFKGSSSVTPTLFSFLFSFLCTFLVLGISRGRKAKNTTLILTGLALSSLFSAITTLLQYFANDSTLSSAIYWTFGDLSRTNLWDCLIMGIAVCAAFVFFYTQRWSLNGLSLGEAQSKSLGLDSSFLRFLYLLIASIVIGVCLSYVGIISFIGLIGPHIAKKIFHQDHKFLLFGSFFIGEILTLASDNLSRLLFNGISLPVGAVLSILGVPFFLFLVLRKENF